MKLDIKIMAVPSRRPYVLKILEQLGLDETAVVYDDRGVKGDAMYNAKRCWLQPFEDYTHRLVLQDDVEVCDNFIPTVMKMIEKYPLAIFSLYSSRTKFEHRTVDSPYVKVSGEGIWGQAVIIPTEFIEDCFAWSDATFGKDYPHDDSAIGLFASAVKIPVLTTIPSTVQHMCPNASVLGYNNKNKISKVWVGSDVSNENWDSDEYSVTPYFPNNPCLKKVNK